MLFFEALFFPDKSENNLQKKGKNYLLGSGKKRFSSEKKIIGNLTLKSPDGLDGLPEIATECIFLHEQTNLK